MRLDHTGPHHHCPPPAWVAARPSTTTTSIKKKKKKTAQGHTTTVRHDPWCALREGLVQVDHRGGHAYLAPCVVCGRRLERCRRCVAAEPARLKQTRQTRDSSGVRPPGGPHGTLRCRLPVPPGGARHGRRQEGGDVTQPGLLKVVCSPLPPRSGSGLGGDGKLASRRLRGHGTACARSGGGRSLWVRKWPSHRARRSSVQAGNGPLGARFGSVGLTLGPDRALE